MEKRLIALEERIAGAGVDGFLVTNPKNIYYLTGFWGTAGTVFVSHTRRIFVTDDRYTLVAKQTVKGCDILISRNPLEEIAKLIRDDQLETIGFEDQVSYHFYQALADQFSTYELRPTSQLVEGLRLIKDKTEVALIKEACRISDQAFIDALDFIKPGKTELDVANFLDFRMRELGASGISFDTIAASGYRSAIPHGRASDKVIELGDALTLDFGCYYQHYASDMTRTIFIGQVTQEQEEVYQTVLEANQAVIESTRAGLPNAQFDQLARDVIEAAGYGPYFTHGIGHGLGLDVHEFPYFRKTDDSPLEAGMVVTDEPGIYLDGKFGVRIEDDLLVTETGCEILTLTPKNLIVL